MFLVFFILGINQLDVFSSSDTENLSRSLQTLTKDNHPELQDRLATLVKTLATRGQWYIIWMQ